MNEVYEYRRTPGKGVIWLSAITLILLLAVVQATDATHLMWLVWGLGSFCVFLMIVPRPVSGMMVDDSYLVLSAWRNPRVILLDDISHLRATEASAETQMAVVYKDGAEEGIYSGDLPDMETLVTVMAARGIPVRDVF